MAQAQENKRVDDSRITRRQIDNAAIRDKTGKYAIDYDNHRMWFRASTNTLCPDGILIEADAWRPHMDTFMGYGPLVDGHQYDSVVDRIFGKPTDWEIDGKGLLVQQEFAVETPRGQSAWYLYSNDFARAVSVGWQTKAREDAESKEGIPYERVTEARLLELSAVVLPMDEGALSQHKNPLLEVAVRTLADPDGKRPGWDETDNQYRYRIRDPGLFDDASFKTLSIDVKGKGDVQVVRGKLKSDGDMHAQAVHFVKDAGWTLSAAKSWWTDHKEDLGRDRLPTGLTFYALDELARDAVEFECDPEDRIGRILGLMKDLVYRVAACQTALHYLEQRALETRPESDAITPAPRTLPDPPEWMAEFTRLAGACEYEGDELAARLEQIRTE